MFTERFLRHRRGVSLNDQERARLEASISEIKTLPPRTNIVLAGEPMNQSILLVEGFMSRYIDDRNGLRQLVAVHVPGDFVDLHAYPLKVLDHDVATMTAATVAIVPHEELDAITSELPAITRKLWFSTLIDAAWTCFRKVESFPEMKGELDDEATTVYKGIRGRGGPAGGDQRTHAARGCGKSGGRLVNAGTVDRPSP
jgi:CRP-like cAMP-binding protein